MSAENKKGLVIITGASSGIGAETARQFSKAGHPLLLLARRVDRMEALGLPNAMCVKLDVADKAGWEAAVKEAEAKFGPTVLLVNNAGLMLLGDPASQDLAEAERMLQVNVLGVMTGVVSVLGGMKERKSGMVVTVGSLAGQKAFPNHAAYCATKFAVRAYTEALREEYAPQGVRFVTISPGVVETELLGHQTNAAIIDGYTKWKATMLKGCLLPEDVSNAIWFAFNQPERCLIREITLSPAEQGP